MPCPENDIRAVQVLDDYRLMVVEAIAVNGLTVRRTSDPSLDRPAASSATLRDRACFSKCSKRAPPFHANEQHE
jgi:hypothetical protein